MIDTSIILVDDEFDFARNSVQVLIVERPFALGLRFAFSNDRQFACFTFLDRFAFQIRDNSRFDFYKEDGIIGVE